MKMKLKHIYIILMSLLIGLIPLKADASIITLNKSSTILGVGYSETLTATVGSGLNSSNIVWTSSNPSVVSVTNGKILAIRESDSPVIITASINGQRATCKVTVSPTFVAVEGISLNKSSLNILVGTTETLIKTINPSNASNQDVMWTSSDTSVAKVDSNGKVTAIKNGKAIITVSASGYKDTCVVNVVSNISLKGISLNKTNLTIKENAKEKLKVTYNPSNATNQKITWKSSNTNVAKVDSNGMVTGVKAGNATITAVSNDGGYVSICKVTVEAISKKVTSVSLDKTELKILAGEKETLKATISPNYAENKNVTWESSDEEVATVEDGIITAISPGEAEIKVITEDGEKEATCKVTVTSKPVKSISFETKEKTVYIDSETKLKIVSDPINSSLENPVWKSSDEEVATVEDGIIKANSIGKTTITVSNEDGTITASIDITVIAKPKEKLNITVEGYELNFNPDVKDYDLKIGSEDKITINTNVSADKVIIKGNQNLENGSIITIEVTDEEKSIYVINIKKDKNYTIIFIAIISVLLLLNLIRILINNKKKS